MAEGSLAVELDTLRRALGDPDLERIPPRLTLVPPVNVVEDRVGDALAQLRGAARMVEPFEIALGPVATFDPVTPTVHLAVIDDAGAVAALRDRVFREPLSRRVDHGFVAHVTLRQQAPRHRLHAALVALAGYRTRWRPERITLLEERREADRVRRWRPVGDVDLGGVRVVGRGGLEWELTAGTLLDPEVVGRLDLDDAATSFHGSAGPGQRLVVSLRRPDAGVAGVAFGLLGSEPRLVVVPDPVGLDRDAEDHLRAEFRWRSETRPDRG